MIASGETDKLSPKTLLKCRCIENSFINMRRLFQIVVIAVLFAGSFSRPAGAQGCSMCQATAAAQSARAARSLNQAIVLLLVPPVTIMSSILIFAFRRRNGPAS
jgi:hypothetical protein